MAIQVVLVDVSAPGTGVGAGGAPTGFFKSVFGLCPTTGPALGTLDRDLRILSPCCVSWGLCTSELFFKHCRITVSDIEKELLELRESQERGKAAMENSVSEASLYLQDQVNGLWGRVPASGPRVCSLALTTWR